MALKVEDVYNNALNIVKRPRIDTFYDATIEAIIGADIFSETRDEALAMKPWDFARAEATLVTSGQTAPTPWAQEYLYPSGSVMLLQVRPGTVVTNDPAPMRWHEFLDTRLSAPQRAVLCDFSPAVAIFTQRVIDPASWPADYIEVLVMMLAKKIEIELHRQERREKPDAS